MVSERQDLGTQIPVYVCYTVDPQWEDPDEYEYALVVFDEEEAKKWVEETTKDFEYQNGKSRARAEYVKTTLMVPEDVYVYKWRDSGWAGEKQRKWEEKQQRQKDKDNDTE